MWGSGTQPRMEDARIGVCFTAAMARGGAQGRRNRPHPSEVAVRARLMAVDFLQRGSKEKFLDPEERDDPFTQTDLWYDRECANISAALVMVLSRLGVVAKTVDGFFDGTARSSHHTWVEFPDGTWIDPTSAQLGLPVCVILPPGDDRRRFYTPVPTAATVS